MPPPIAISPDLHLHEHEQFARQENGMNSRLMDGLRVVKHILDTAKAAGCKSLLVPGDWFHDRKQIRVPVLEVSEEILKYAKKININVFELIGNHDISRDGHSNSVEGQRFTDVWTEPGVQTVDGWRIGAIPWTDDAEVVKKGLTAKADFYIGHVGVSGSKVGPSDFEIPGHVEESVFAKKPVFLGHYHKPQQLKGTRTHYVGSPLQLNWGERGEEKRFIIYRGDGKFDSVKLDGFPKFVRVGPDEADECRSQDFVEVIVDRQEQIERTRSLIHDKKINGHVILSEIPAESPPILSLEGKSQRAQVEAYAKEVGFPDDVDAKRAMKIAYDLLGIGDNDAA